MIRTGAARGDDTTALDESTQQTPNTFLGACYRRLARRIGKQKAQVAVARSILVIVWHLLADPTSRYCDLGPDFFDTRIRPERRKQNHIHQLEALGYKVALEPAA